MALHGEVQEYRRDDEQGQAARAERREQERRRAEDGRGGAPGDRVAPVAEPAGYRSAAAPEAPTSANTATPVWFRPWCRVSSSAMAVQ